MCSLEGGVSGGVAWDGVGSAPHQCRRSSGQCRDEDREVHRRVGVVALPLLPQTLVRILLLAATCHGMTNPVLMCVALQGPPPFS
jgi:hypothetical protein